MRKIIKIGEKEIPMLSNAMIRMYYRSNFNRKLLSDLMSTKKLLSLESKVKDKSNDEIMELLTDEEITIIEDLSDNCLKMAWTMAYAEDKGILPFNEWVESLGEFKIFDNWLSEVLELLMTTFC